MKTFIYILQCPITLHVKYVGKTENPKRRMQAHLWEKPKVKTYCQKWINSLRKQNKKPIMTVIDETEGNWKELEQYWISQFKNWGFKLTNLTEGGEGSKGAGHLKYKKVSIYSKDGTYIKTFESIKHAATEYKCHHSQIIRACKGEIKNSFGVQWKYGTSKKTIKSSNRYDKKTKYTSIQQIDLKGNVIKIFTCVADIIKETGYNNANIYQCINGKRKTSNNYIWKIV